MSDIKQEEKKEKTQEKSGEKSTTRLIVKGVPKHLTDERLKEHFSKKGIVTDAKIMRKGTKSRLFGFVGFKTTEEAMTAKKYFNNTFIDTSKIIVDYAKAQDDPDLPRPWSKYAQGSSAYKVLHGNEDGKTKKKQSEEEKKAKEEEIERKKEKFKQFLKVMGVSKENKQSWNDSFTAFMADEGPTLISKPNEKKRKAKEESKAKEEKPSEEQKEEKKDEPSEGDIDEQRLYVMNLPFTISHDELRDLFQKYGEVEEIEIPLRRGGTGYGFAFIRFQTIEGAVSAFAELDKTFFQGRKIHIKPAQKKPPPKQIDFSQFDSQPQQEGQINENPDEQQQQQHEQQEQQETKRPPKQSAFKEEKEKEIRANFDDETNWNYLFMNQDSVATAMSSKLNISKGSLLDKNQGNLAVRLAKAEAIIINQTKEWLQQNGINVDKLESTDRLKCKRSRTVILVKNIPYSTKESELKEVFERYGVLTKIQISPFNTLAIVEFENEKQAKAAMKNLANYKINYIMPLYLEYAPKFVASSLQDQKPEQEAEEQDEQQKEEENADLIKEDRTIFVKNLNFSTTEEMLEQVFKEAKVGKIISCKVVRNSKSQLSRGYGFVEMESKAAAEKAIKKLQNFLLEDHSLKLNLSTKNVNTKQKKEKEDKVLEKRKQKTELSVVETTEQNQSNKLLVKNLAFEATEADIKSLFKEYGALKKVRMPKKVNSKSHRGFGFVEFVSSEEAKNAFKHLQHNHLYGRKLVIEWAKPDDNAFAEDKTQKVETNKPNNKRQKIN